VFSNSSTRGSASGVSISSPPLVAAVGVSKCFMLPVAASVLVIVVVVVDVCVTDLDVEDGVTDVVGDGGGVGGGVGA